MKWHPGQLAHLWVPLQPEKWRLVLMFRMTEDFPDGPVAKNLPANAGYVGSIPGWEL